MKNEELIGFINNEIKCVKKIMVDRATTNELPEDEMEQLFDIDYIDPFDQDDSRNHNYDLGRLKTLEEIMSKVLLVVNHERSENYVENMNLIAEYYNWEQVSENTYLLPDLFPFNQSDEGVNPINVLDFQFEDDWNWLINLYSKLSKEFPLSTYDKLIHCLITTNNAKALRADIDVLSLPRRVYCDTEITLRIIAHKFSECHIGTSVNWKELFIQA